MTSCVKQYEMEIIMRKTKIICTLGPATREDTVLKELIESGMNVARFNFSHGSRESHGKDMERVRRMRKELGIPVAMLLDTSGPEIRLGEFQEERVYLTEGNSFVLTTREVLGNEEMASISYKELGKDVDVGMEILLDDGLISLEVEELTQTDIVCRVKNGGMVSSHKGVNVPYAKLSMEYLSEKDKKDIAFGVEQGVDYIAASFVRTGEDVDQIRKLLEELQDPNMKIIAKIENRQGVENLEEILKKADGVMIARGDLGVEIPIKEVPAIQKVMIKKCLQAGKIVITATQMLESMINNPRPTRAETTDVANAIYDGSSAIMLSGETAAGKYPVEAVKTMVEIAEYTESDIDYEKRFRMLEKADSHDVTNAISHATCMMAIDIDAAGIITITKSGRTARMVSRYRPDCPIIGCTPSERSYYQLSLSWGVLPLRIQEETNTEKLVENALKICVANGIIKKEDLAVITAGLPLGVSGTTNLIRIASMEKL